MIDRFAILVLYEGSSLLPLIPSIRDISRLSSAVIGVSSWGGWGSCIIVWTGILFRTASLSLSNRL